MFIIDREMFKRWVMGELMGFHSGRGFAVDELKCEKAHESLDKGQTVLFTENDILTGTEMVLTNEGYVEREILKK
ncbi:MAG: hypothetical protein GF364_05020 [Candidatus Lokiarchaeota archaeon]|nr:hypothetical protein [Candidatus Lokiarchaeota archaeon]